MSASSSQRVRSRRRVLMGAGFVVLALASMTACIFDKSDYKGGGRIDKGATAATASATDTTTATATDTTTPTAPDAANPLVDAGLTD